MFNDKLSKMNRQQLLQLVIAVTLIMLFLAGCGSSEAPTATATPEPPATSTPEPPATSTPEPVVVNDPLHAGDTAPDFTLPDSNGNMVSLAALLQDNEMVVLVFYYSDT